MHNMHLIRINYKDKTNNDDNDDNNNNIIIIIIIITLIINIINVVISIFRSAQSKGHTKDPQRGVEESLQPGLRMAGFAGVAPPGAPATDSWSDQPFVARLLGLDMRATCALLYEWPHPLPEIIQNMYGTYFD